MRPSLSRSLSKAALLLPFLLVACDPPDPTPQPDPAPKDLGELRGLWVDAFGPGLKTPAEIDQLVMDAKTMKVNVLFAQVGRRGDCYCNNAAMPRTNDPAVPAGFDPLADLITKAHAQGIQVHAWIITTAIWNSATPPSDPAHAFNAHGPSATGADYWLMVKNDGTVKGGADWMLDPGHPDAAEYIKNMYVSVVKNYDVDGIQFDRVRYPDYNPVGGPNNWGYNPAALARYQAETGASGTPDPADAKWSAWRVQQVTNLVRETALAVKAVKPDVSVNAATITYGEGPADDATFLNSRTYKEVLQDWPTWVREGYLDINVMMNYKRDHVPAQALWFDQWNQYAATLRPVAPAVAQVSGAAIYLNYTDGSLAQAKKTFAAGLDGWAGYSYRTPDVTVYGVGLPADVPPRTQPVAFAELASKLTAPGAPFEQAASWSRPETTSFRAVSGRVTVGSGPLGSRVVELVDRQGNVVASTQTNGQGEYGFMRLAPGSYTVQVSGVQSGTFTPLTGQVSKLATLNIP